jgi:hypothetical protein
MLGEPPREEIDGRAPRIELRHGELGVRPAVLREPDLVAPETRGADVLARVVDDRGRGDIHRLGVADLLGLGGVHARRVDEILGPRKERAHLEFRA